MLNETNSFAENIEDSLFIDALDIHDVVPLPAAVATLRYVFAEIPDLYLSRILANEDVNALSDDLFYEKNPQWVVNGVRQSIANNRSAGQLRLLSEKQLVRTIETPNIHNNSIFFFTFAPSGSLYLLRGIIKSTCWVLAIPWLRFLESCQSALVLVRRVGSSVRC